MVDKPKNEPIKVVRNTCSKDLIIIKKNKKKIEVSATQQNVVLNLDKRIEKEKNDNV
jgi:hypothetical protein